MPPPLPLPLQVHTYLHAYASKAGLPRRLLASCDALLHAAQRSVRAYRDAMQADGGELQPPHPHAHACCGSSPAAAQAAAAAAAAAEALFSYLDAGVALARRQFARFNVPAMVVGCSLLLAAVALHLTSLTRQARHSDPALSVACHPTRS